MAEGEVEGEVEMSAVEVEVGVEGEEEGGVEAGVSRGWPFEWLGWKSQGLEARDGRGSAIEGAVIPGSTMSFRLCMRTVQHLIGLLKAKATFVTSMYFTLRCYAAANRTLHPYRKKHNTY